METKPWDKLREIAPVPPIRKGNWQSMSGTLVLGPLISVEEFERNGVSIRFGSARNDSLLFQKKALRDLAEFCIELADQLPMGL